MSEEDQNLLYNELYKSPNKERQKMCLIRLLSTTKDGLVRYSKTEIGRNGINSLWILKNSISLLSSFDQLYVRAATSVRTFDF